MKEMSLGERIRFSRKEAALKRTDLAKLLECDQLNIYRWEVGRHNPSNMVITKIAEITGVSNSWLHTGEGLPHPIYASEFELSNVSDRIRYSLQNAGLTQKQACQKLGISENSMSKYTTGKIKPPVYFLRALASITNTNIEFLLTGSEVENASNPDCPVCCWIRRLIVLKFCVVIDIGKIDSTDFIHCPRCGKKL